MVCVSGCELSPIRAEEESKLHSIVVRIEKDIDREEVEDCVERRILDSVRENLEGSVDEVLVESYLELWRGTRWRISDLPSSSEPPPFRYG